jgi:hypothetical protein
MAIAEFFLSLQVAERTEQWARAIVGSGDSLAFDAWLTPSVVAGYDREDFVDHLSDIQLDQLSVAVAAFERVANQVPNGPATRAQAEEGLRHLQTVLSIVRQLPEWAGE